ncbi:MAG: response regulator transcription factor [Firmicutes bacterium]|nr:response regulator transcription factor [Bacillota bacterium]
MAIILIVEDDESMRELMSAKLEKKFTVIGAPNSKAALNIIETVQVDLIVSDIMMPGGSGYDFVRTLRNLGLQMPVIMATAKQGFDDKKDGFSVGADDYMVKPINFDELTWRIDALLRRSKIAADKEIKLGKFRLNATTFEAAYDGNPIELTRKEFDLTFKLLSYPNKLFSHDKLLNDIWGYDCPSGETTIRSHVNRLRNKFEHISEFEIVTIRGLGYKAVLHTAL